MRPSLGGLNRRQLRRWLLVFLLALAAPTAVLVYQAYDQLKWQAFHQYQVLAEELASRIDEHFSTLIDAEEARTFADYAFVVVAGDPAANFLQRSPLSAYPPDAGLPGLIGYFQVDAEGEFSTPLLPQASANASEFGISPPELRQRQALAQRIRGILSENRLVQAGGARASGEGSPARRLRDLQEEQMQEQDAVAAYEAGEGLSKAPGQAPGSSIAAAPAEQQVPAQAAFDRLNTPAAKQEQKKKQALTGKLGRVEDLRLDKRYQRAPAVERQQESASAKEEPEKRARMERSVLPELPPTRGAPSPGAAPAAGDSSGASGRNHIRIFESEIDPFELSLLDSGHFVLFRKVWRNGQRFIQGALLDPGPFLQGVVQPAFRETALSRISDLIIAYQGQVFSAFSGDKTRNHLSSGDRLSGALLYQTRLSAPLGDMEVIFSVTRMPAGPGGTLITWLAVILATVLCGGFYLMYRLGSSQIELSQQQQDFVSAVSHELKTPLTSIRMYGEMLREGWAPEDKKKTYYDFIFEESERLSRLISNVLQLARMTRNEVKIKPKAASVAELVDGIRSKVNSQVAQAGFALNLDCDADTAQARLLVDTDAFAQIMINLVDNALKFSAKAGQKTIDVACRQASTGGVQFGVRDYGPGVPPGQMKKIFKLFYRSEGELTRETVGTGIGLSLVRELAQAMGAQVDVVNRRPGAEFTVTFPVNPSADRVQVGKSTAKTPSSSSDIS